MNIAILILCIAIILLGLKINSNQGIITNNQSRMGEALAEILKNKSEEEKPTKKKSKFQQRLEDLQKKQTTKMK